LISVIAAPSNLGLRPPAPGAVPGCAKAPEALREAGLYRRLAAGGAQDGGVVLPGRYLDDAVAGVPRLRNQEALVDHARRLAERVGRALDDGTTPLLLGGDCSILVGTCLALARRGRFALVHLDGHTDFRHPGNSDSCASLAGEDLAAAVGRHWAAVADLDGLGPYIDPQHAVHIGCRDDDEHLDEARATLGAVVTAAEMRARGPEATAEAVIARVGSRDLAGYWIHLDVDVLDPAVMPAVDSPDPGGLTADELTTLLALLAPGAAGAQVTVFDPDLDPGGRYASTLTDVVADGLGGLGRG
jgi:arginase